MSSIQLCYCSSEKECLEPLEAQKTQRQSSFLMTDFFQRSRESQWTSWRGNSFSGLLLNLFYIINIYTIYINQFLRLIFSCNLFQYSTFDDDAKSSYIRVYKHQMNYQDQRQQRTSKIIIELNKSGLSYLTHNKFSQAFEYFKQSQKIVQGQLKVNPSSHKTNKLAGIVFNNLACYYKKINKPKISLIYLEKALDIEVNKVEDWAATASTHLNICAIYSFMKDHQSAASHAQLSQNMLDKIQEYSVAQPDSFSITNAPQSLLRNKSDQKADEDKSISHLRMLSHYNLAIELEHLKRFEQSIQEFLKAKEWAKKLGKKNTAIIMVCDESISRMRDEMNRMKQKLIEIVTKKRVADEKGYHSFMRKNKKNVQHRSPNNEPLKKVRGLSLYEQKPHYRTNTFLRLKTSPKTDQNPNTPHYRNSSFSHL